MSQLLKVVTAFGPFTVGQVISDPGQVAAILAAGYGSNVTDGNTATGAPDAIVTVFGPPNPALGLTYRFAFDRSSTPKTLYEWLGTAWGIALQAGGTAPPLAAPGAIAAAPTLSAATSSTLAIAWLAPTTGGAPADTLVQYRATGTTPWTTIDTGSTALAATIPGLSAATSYDIQVIATNSAGQGAASPILTVSTSAVAPVLQALGLSSLNAAPGVAWTAAITGQTAGSTVVATSSDGTVLSVANGQVSGTFAAGGLPTVTLSETLPGATGSPKSTQAVVTVSAAAVDRTATTDLSNPDRGLNPLI